MFFCVYYWFLTLYILIHCTRMFRVYDRKSILYLFVRLVWQNWQNKNCITILRIPKYIFVQNINKKRPPWFLFNVYSSISSKGNKKYVCLALYTGNGKTILCIWEIVCKIFWIQQIELPNNKKKNHMTLEWLLWVIDRPGRVLVLSF